MADGDSPKAVKDEENTFSFLLFPIKIILHTMVMILKHDKNVELLILREHLISPQSLLFLLNRKQNRSRKSDDREYNDKMTKIHATAERKIKVHKTLHRNLTIDKDVFYYKDGEIRCSRRISNSTFLSCFKIITSPSEVTYLSADVCFAVR
jgi:hypothetical protein